MIESVEVSMLFGWLSFVRVSLQVLDIFERLGRQVVTLNVLQRHAPWLREWDPGRQPPPRVEFAKVVGRVKPGHKHLWYIVRGAAAQKSNHQSYRGIVVLELNQFLPNNQLGESAWIGEPT